MYCPNCGKPQEQTANFCSACGVRLPRTASPVAAESGPAPLPTVEPKVKILDAGSRLLLSGASAQEVQRVLDEYVREGAHVVTAVCQLGKFWTAACSIPPRTEKLDESGTFSLAEFQQAAAKLKHDELDDGCRIEELGFKRAIYGPSRLAVQRRIEHMRQSGGELVGEIEQVEEEWFAICDMGDANTTYRW